MVSRREYGAGVAMANVDKSRRQFLSRLFAGLGILAGLEAIWMTVSTLGSRRTTTQPGQGRRFEAGAVAQFPIDSVTPFPEAGFYLSRLEDGGFLALDRQCTHLGCNASWHPDEQRFVCPCHASAFDIRGSVLNGPAPRPLNLYPVTVDEGLVLVDTATRLRRNTFEPEQAAGTGQDA